MATLRLESTRFATDTGSMDYGGIYLEIYNDGYPDTALRRLPLRNSAMVPGPKVHNGQYVKVIATHVPDEFDEFYFAKVLKESNGQKTIEGYVYEKHLVGLITTIPATMRNPRKNETQLRKNPDGYPDGIVVPNNARVKLLEINRTSKWGSCKDYLSVKVEYNGAKGWTGELNIVGLGFPWEEHNGRVGSSLFDTPVILSCKFDDVREIHTALEGAVGDSGYSSSHRFSDAIAQASLDARPSHEAPNARKAHTELGGLPAERDRMLVYPNRYDFAKECKPNCDGRQGRCESHKRGNCWRSAFRCHLRLVNQRGGRFLQVIDGGSLGAGQQQEIQWAQEERMKICHWDGTEPFVLNIKEGPWRG